MAIHTVQQGECISSIAHHYGFTDWRTIWNHANNADLRRRRPNPNILRAGDRIFIPDHQQRDVGRSTGSLHAFVAPSSTVLLRLKIQDEADQPLANKRYELTVAGTTHHGTLNAEGILEQTVPASATQGELKVWPENPAYECDDYVFPLAIGHLDPIDENTGVQGRLYNLGFDVGAIDGDIGARTREMLRAFQDTYSLDVNGELNDQTRNRIRELHDGSS
jgi:N-acetylmuramoyl-L-alanine amidase